MSDPLLILSSTTTQPPTVKPRLWAIPRG